MVVLGGAPGDGAPVGPAGRLMGDVIVERGEELLGTVLLERREERDRGPAT